MRHTNKYLLAVITLAIGLVLGIGIGRFFTKHNIPVTFSCSDIAYFHADLMMKNYGTTSNTDSTNPNRAINQRASDLNAAILKICHTDPREEKCDTELSEATLRLCNQSQK